MYLEGEDGGSVYVATTADVVRCGEVELEQLLLDLDFIAWPGADDGSRRVVYEQLREGQRLEDSFVEGPVVLGIWVHQEFDARGIAEEIRDVVLGRTTRISEKGLYRGKPKQRERP
ncbi:hypothetical protein [uncultured Jatrophihabitans sp.]|uniref:hypothetical protein n=1 Tax=uncultured Jatrophihabitans sp. TaxID=1610747 RepID=UPI0035CAC42C